MAARYRQTASRSTAKSDPGAPIKDVADNSSKSPSPSSFSVLDILRILGGIIVLSSGLSYLSTSGESMTWGYNAWWTRAREWKAIWQGGIQLTDTQLLAYDGTDPTKPIYLALNGTIYDVSANRGTYGPGGSYHFFAGRDAARAFLTGCFMEDQTPDLRGVEMMYMPKDPEPGTEEYKKLPVLTSAERKNRQAQELRKARKQVREGLEHWHKMFRGDKGKKYFRVGEVKRERGWLEKLPRRELCAEGEKARPIRKPAGEE
ncbi:hypothetical protein B0J11DRAFT_603571 [Dendryphion nanum]|uniref:Cytochrome b5 heme-binding domain-containing protein n=1 Tax=Dendryphion nanum TaxID=256645 RepID=A0A9P9IPM4_9PLEO|nr:hypothetical protein B0J11DRAFT_603571 [Dendryphion nanum]